MSIGRRNMKKLTFDRSEGDQITKTVPMPEAGGMGYFSVWHRRVAGSANATMEVYASFSATPSEDALYELNSGNIYDTLDTFMWGWYADFPYLTFVVDFTNSEEPPPPPEDPEEPIPPVPVEAGTVEIYITAY